jgi:hypothetical protein
MPTATTQCAINLGKSTRKLNSKPSVRKDFVVKPGYGLLLGFILPGTRHEMTETTTSARWNSWLQIGPDSSVTLKISSPEMEQDSFSTLARALGDHLAVDCREVRIVQQSPALVMSARTAKMTGAKGLRINCWKLRSAGAVARDMLTSAAMQINGDHDCLNFSVKNGVILHLTSRKTYPFSQVATAAGFQPLPGGGGDPVANLCLTGGPNPPHEFRAKLQSDTRAPEPSVPELLSIVARSPLLGGRSSLAPLAGACEGVVG